jgi:hypothetical protein
MPRRSVSAGHGLRRVYSATRSSVTRDRGEDAPHLILTVDSGHVFFVNGTHAADECRNLTTAEPDQHGLIVAVPGGERALFSPPDAIVAE